MPKWLAGLKRPVLMGFIVALLAAGYSLRIPNTYRSIVTILPPASESSGGMSGLGALGAFAAAFSGGGGGHSNGQAVSILGSRWLRQELLKSEFEFSEASWAFGKPKSYKLKLYDYLQPRDMDDAVARLGGMITVDKDTDTDTLNVTVVSRSQALCQQVAARATELLEEYFSTKTRTHGSEKAAFAGERLKDLTNQLKEDEKRLRDFTAQNRMFQTSSDPVVRLEGERLTAEYKFQEQLVASYRLNYEQSMTEAKNDMPILNILDRANYPYVKFKPQRSFIVLFTFLFATAAAWCWSQRAVLFKDSV